MRIHTLFIALLLGIVPTAAQITITNSSFYTVGDTLRLAQDNTPQGVTPGMSGENQVWDFSAIGVDTTLVIPVLNASQGSAFASFPDANMLLNNGFGESYYTRSPSEITLLGFVGGGFGGFPISITPTYNPPVIEKRAPMNFFDVNTSESSFLVAFGTAILPDSLFAALPLKPDSIRINQSLSRLDVVDGWGETIIPGGSYESLRERRRTITETTVEVQVFGLWVDLATFGFPLPGLGKDTTLEYHYYAADIKEPIAILEVDPDNPDVVFQVQYKNNGVSSIHQPKPLAVSLFRGPSPAMDMVRFDMNVLTQPARLEIFSAHGQLVLSREGLHGIISQDVSILPQGMHVYRVMNAGQLIESGTFLIQR
ncbi:MAG: T9SS type A sorting domain-containing protein [Saprospiraceae bacterium]|nr:T9SS type A sorting domain-containing protein [Saprospiraceae bacterium]